MPRRTPARAAVVLLGLLAAALLASGLVLPAAGARTHYTTPTELRDATPTCPIHENYPPTAVADNRAWAKPTSQRVGWRYHVDGSWALVLDYNRQGNPHWGFIRRSCLQNPPNHRPLLGKGGDGHFERVPFSPAPRPRIGAGRFGTVHTLRSSPTSFVTGNLRPGDRFEFTASCTRSGNWVFGYAPVARRWGWVLTAGLSGAHCRWRRATGSG
jgi:hypothetical protein